MVLLSTFTFTTQPAALPHDDYRTHRAAPRQHGTNEPHVMPTPYLPSCTAYYRPHLDVGFTHFLHLAAQNFHTSYPRCAPPYPHGTRTRPYSLGPFFRLLAASGWISLMATRKTQHDAATVTDVCWAQVHFSTAGQDGRGQRRDAAFFCRYAENPTLTHWTLPRDAGGHLPASGLPVAAMVRFGHSKTGTQHGFKLPSYLTLYAFYHFRVYTERGMPPPLPYYRWKERTTHTRGSEDQSNTLLTFLSSTSPLHYALCLCNRPMACHTTHTPAAPTLCFPPPPHRSPHPFYTHILHETGSTTA